MLLPIDQRICFQHRLRNAAAPPLRQWHPYGDAENYDQDDQHAPSDEDCLRVKGIACEPATTHDCWLSGGEDKLCHINKPVISSQNSGGMRTNIGLIQAQYGNSDIHKR